MVSRLEETSIKKEKKLRIILMNAEKRETVIYHIFVSARNYQKLISLSEDSHFCDKSAHILCSIKGFVSLLSL